MLPGLAMSKSEKRAQLNDLIGLNLLLMVHNTSSYISSPTNLAVLCAAVLRLADSFLLLSGPSSGLSSILSYDC